jgi:hypothetical protein
MKKDRITDMELCLPAEASSAPAENPNNQFRTCIRLAAEFDHAKIHSASGVIPRGPACNDGRVRTPRLRIPWGWALPLLLAAAAAAQSLPRTAGETLAGGSIVVADAVGGAPAVLVAGFSREAGDGIAAWSRALDSDPVLARARVFQLVMLERAPGFVRALIKRSMRKSMPPAAQSRAVVLTADEPAWRAYFGMDNDRDPWVVLLDANRRILWHGHGQARDLEPLLRAALK